MCLAPLLMAVKVPPSGGLAPPNLSKPQHTATPSSRSPQVWNPPLLMAAKVSPFGGFAWPFLLLPQHTAAPSSRNPQVWFSPLLIAVKATVACPPLHPTTSAAVSRTHSASARPPKLYFNTFSPVSKQSEIFEMISWRDYPGRPAYCSDVVSRGFNDCHQGYSGAANASYSVAVQ